MMSRAAIRVSLSGMSLVCAVGLVATTVPVRVAEAATQPPAFEVASIKPNKSGSGSSHSGFDDGRFTATNIQIKTLLQYDAYEIPAPQIQGGPGWPTSERFDIEAKVDDTTVNQMAKLSREQRNLLKQQMVQQLLADRFKLAIHWETKELPVYALVIAKNGPKFQKSSNADGETSISSSNGRYTAQDVTMGKLAQSLTQLLSRELGRIVIDKTAIEGKYDLAFTREPEDHPTAAGNALNESPAPSGPSIFTVLQEQLGLKLESAKGPVEILVIDHIEQPSEN
jgi:uncharacterized protein (TIGR03435 family)